jgi:hypothetical protein
MLKNILFYFKKINNSKISNKYLTLNKYIKENNYIFYFLLLFILIIHQIIFQNLIIFNNTMVAEDFYFSLPNLIFGKIWYFKNGLFNPPHFIASQGGGVPFYADPQSSYYSVFQIFFILFKISSALKIIFILFTLIGFFGSYLLLKKSFKFERYSSLLGATLFIFNGFFINRFLVGHLFLTYYIFLPFYCFLLFSTILNKKLYIRKISLILSSIIFSSFFFAGASTIIIQSTYSIVIVVLIFYIKYKNYNIFINFIYSILLSLLISLSNIFYKIHFYLQFTRELGGTTLNGFGSFLYTSLTSLFFVPDPFFYKENQISNIKTYLSVAELEFGLSIISLILLIIFLKKIRNFYINKNIILYFFFFIVLILPSFYIFNFFLITNFLEKIPIVGAIWERNRWLLTYIYPIIVINTFVVHRFFSNKNTLIIIVFMFIPIFQTLTYHKIRNEFYPEKSFKNKAVYSIDNLEKFSNSITIKNIDKLHVKYIDYIEDQNRLDKNEGFISNTSKLFSYSPIFGYYMEKLPIENIIKKRSHYLSEIKLQGEKYNMFNPVCFLFPKENNCFPGEKLNKNQKGNLEKLINYKPINFNISLVQKVANNISLFSIIILLIALIRLIFLYIITTILKKN